MSMFGLLAQVNPPSTGPSRTTGSIECNPDDLLLLLSPFLPSLCVTHCLDWAAGSGGLSDRRINAGELKPCLQIVGYISINLYSH